MNIIIAILILGFIIFIHELGHFITAKFFKMPVEEFSIGMGTAIYTYETEETKYSIRAIPLGGYVNIGGMDIDSEVENGFNSKPAYARFIVLIAGVTMNFLLAFVILFSVTLKNGIYVEVGTKIGEVLSTAPAKEVLLPKDEILEINGKKIHNWQDIRDSKKNNNNDKIDIKVRREGKELEFTIPYLENKTGKKTIGILPELEHKKVGVIYSAEKSIKLGVKIFQETVHGLKQMVTGKVKAEEISGPIGIVKVVGQVTKDGIGPLLILTALLTINIGVLNLLPLPALDGGRLIFVILEILRIKVSKKIEEKIHMIGMMILFLFIIFITINDIFNIF